MFKDNLSPRKSQFNASPQSWIREFTGIALVLLMWSVCDQHLYCQQGSYLPLIVIDNHGNPIEYSTTYSADIKVIDNGTGKQNFPGQPGTDYEGKAGIKIRGQSSLMFPKSSYSIETRFESGADSSVSLLGMPAESDWILYAPYSDKSLMRNALTYYLGRRMNGDWNPRFRFCEMFLNGEYNGIYMLIEKIKRGKERVNISKLKPDEISGDDLTGGYIVKVDRIAGLSPDEYFEEIPSTHEHATDNYFFTYVYPDWDKIMPQQKDYIKRFLTNADNTIGNSFFRDPVNGFRKYFDVNSFVDYQIITELTNNVDGYRLSMYFFKDKDSKGGKLHAGPIWDYDLAYGNEDFADWALRTDTWLYPKFTIDYGGRIHWWDRLMQDYRYRTAFVSRWKALRQGAFSTDSVMTYIDNTISYLGDAIKRNFERWPVIGTYVWPNYYVGATYEEEVNYFKEWVRTRMDWIDGNIEEAGNTGNLEPGTEIIVYPNPANAALNISIYLSSSVKLDVEMFDLAGRTVYADIFKPVSSGYQYASFDISRLSAGYYVLRISQEGRLIARKKIIIR